MLMLPPAAPPEDKPEARLTLDGALDEQMPEEVMELGGSP
jgi:hypothetical protein